MANINTNDYYYYSHLYGVQPTAMTNYEMSDDDKQLFGGRTL